MIRLLHIIILTLMPIILSANSPLERYNDRLEGRWYESWNGHEIKIKQKGHGIKVKGLNGRRKWVRFDHIRNNKFRDCDNNIIRIHSPGSLTYVSNCGRYSNRYNRERGSNHTYYSGQGQCAPPAVHVEEEYYEYYEPRAHPRGTSYWVRELDEHIDIEITNYGLRAKRQGRSWVEYEQNRYRKNEYIDQKGNRYIRLDDRTFRWKDRRGERSLILTRRR